MKALEREIEMEISVQTNWKAVDGRRTFLEIYTSTLNNIDGRWQSTFTGCTDEKGPTRSADEHCSILFSIEYADYRPPNEASNNLITRTRMTFSL